MPFLCRMKDPAEPLDRKAYREKEHQRLESKARQEDHDKQHYDCQHAPADQPQPFQETSPSLQSTRRHHPEGAKEKGDREQKHQLCGLITQVGEDHHRDDNGRESGMTSEALSKIGGFPTCEARTGICSLVAIRTHLELKMAAHLSIPGPSSFET